jgi:hypothetical protein
MHNKQTLIAAIEFGDSARIEKHTGDTPYILLTKGWPETPCKNMYHLMEEFEKGCYRLSVLQYNMLVALADYDL